jgi:FAD/FMN-containing dehydrogenase
LRAAVRWAARNDVPIAARSGGHSYAGYSTRTGALVVDLAGLGGVAPAPGNRSARVGAGALLIDVYTALARRGVTIPAGSCPTVGIGGLAMGGGVGLASRTFGTTCDNVAALTIVTADGRALECDERRNPDLYWACRGGGGGNFGIVTGFTFRTHRVRAGSWFLARFAWEDAAEVVARWQRWAPNAPDELFSICSLSTGARGPVVTVLGQYVGAQAPLRRLLGGLTRAARPVSLSVGTAGWLDLQLRWAGCLGETTAGCRVPPRDPFGARSDYVAGPLRPDEVASLLHAGERRQGASGAILLDSYGGAINRVPAAATAFVHRDALFSIQYLAYWGASGGAAAAMAWLRATHGAMRPHVSGLAYQNYIDPDLTGWRRAYYGANAARLADVARRYDPDGVFRFRQSI